MCSLSAAVMSSVFVSMTSVSVSDSEFQFRFKSTAAPSWRCRGNMDNRPVTVTTRVTGRYHKMAHQRMRYCCPCCFWTPGAVTAPTGPALHRLFMCKVSSEDARSSRHTNINVLRDASNQRIMVLLFQLKHCETNSP